MDVACVFGVIAVLSVVSTLAVYGHFYGKCADLQSRVKGLKGLVCQWSTSWCQEHDNVLTLNREIEEWKARHLAVARNSALQANKDFAKIKSLEARLADTELSVQVAEQAYAALYSACQAKQCKAKRSHKKGASCQSKS
jgi:hypothetical protein